MRRCLVTRSPQLPSCFNVEFELASAWPNRHAIIAPRRFERNIAGTDVGEHLLRIALQGIPKSAAATDFHQESITSFKRNVTRSFSRRQSLYRSVLAYNAEAVGQRVFTTVQSPRR